MNYTGLTELVGKNGVVCVDHRKTTGDYTEAVVTLHDNRMTVGQRLAIESYTKYTTCLQPRSGRVVKALLKDLGAPQSVMDRRKYMTLSCVTRFEHSYTYKVTFLVTRYPMWTSSNGARRPFEFMNDRHKYNVLRMFNDGRASIGDNLQTFVALLEHLLNERNGCEYRRDRITDAVHASIDCVDLSFLLNTRAADDLRSHSKFREVYRYDTSDCRWVYVPPADRGPQIVLNKLVEHDKDIAIDPYRKPMYVIETEPVHHNYADAMREFAEVFHESEKARADESMTYWDTLGGLDPIRPAPTLIEQGPPMGLYRPGSGRLPLATAIVIDPMTGKPFRR